MPANDLIPRPSKQALAARTLGRLSVSERLLLRMSKHPHDVGVVSDYEAPTSGWTLDNALEHFKRAFPGFVEAIRGKRVLDYGCGDGFQAVAMAQAGAAEVLGVDISKARLANARKLAEQSGTNNVRFLEQADGEYDVVTSLDAVEHFIRPEENLRQMTGALAPGGKVYASFGPLWLSPYGHHMYFFTNAPWIHLAFSERTVYRIRSLYRTDGATTYKPDLNQMTVKGFEQLLADCDVQAEFIDYQTVKGVPLLDRVPLVRELFVNQIHAVLTVKGSAEETELETAR